MGESFIVRRGKNNGIKLIYANGAEYTPIVPGYNVNGGTLSKESDHLNLTTSTTQYSMITYETDNAIDVTNYKTLNFECENVGTVSANERLKIGLGATSGGNHDDFQAVLEIQNAFSRIMKSINIESITGSYFIKCLAFNTEANKIANAKVYKIFLT